MSPNMALHRTIDQLSNHPEFYRPSERRLWLMKGRRCYRHELLLWSLLLLGLPISAP